MTAAIWFGLAAIALAGAIVLLHLDRVQRRRTGHVRQVWAKAQGYTYVSLEPTLAANWRRGAMAKLGYLSAVDVVSGNRKGEKFVLLDLEDTVTMVAVRRQIGSDIDIDLRLKTAAPPKDADLELLGAIGDRVVFATNPDVARHAVDQRMVAFIESLPENVQQLWSEGNWTLGTLPVGTSPRDWEKAIDAVLRLSGLLHVLPPATPARGVPRQPIRDPRPSAPTYPTPNGYPDRTSGDADVRSGRTPVSLGDPNSQREQRRRPALAVVPDPRNRDRRTWPPADQAPGPDTRGGQRPDDGVDAADRSGGPFHPGFRPYQGPAPR